MYDYNELENLVVDREKLYKLSFTDSDINNMNKAIDLVGKLSNQKLLNLGFNYKYAQRIKYMYDICLGKVNLEGINNIARHFKRLYGDIRKLEISDLGVSRLVKVPRYCVLGGIPDGSFEFLNSKNYKGKGRLYRLLGITVNNVLIETDRKPVLRYKEEKKLDGVIAIKEVLDNGRLRYVVNRNNCKICNRYIIMASLRKPEFHHGMVEMVCIDGSRVYVYAKSIGTGVNVGNSMGINRVYDYGIFEGEIKDKILRCASELYKNLRGVCTQIHDGNEKFEVFSKEIKEEEFYAE